jgi:NAD(P) transhydrogenase
MSEHFDLIVIGAGPAGEKGAAQAAYFGKKVLIVERSSRPGGAAAITAWVPSKTLREAALYLTGFEQRDVYEGLSLDLDPAFAVSRLRARSDRVIESVTDSVRDNIEAHGIELMQGEARIGPGRTVVVTTDEQAERELSADAILIATGSRPRHPEGVSFDDPDVIDSDSVLDVTEPVRDLVVIGGGAVGCEYASIFCALGTRVTLLDNASALVPLVDREVGDALAASLRAAGVRIVLETGHVDVSREDGGLVVRSRTGETLRPEKVLFAVGRSGNTAALGVERAGIAVDDRGRIVVDEHYCTSVPGIYAAGDVIGPPQLASVSMEQARVAACHAFDIPFKQMVDPITPIGVYSIPEVASVGLSEERAREQGMAVEIGKASFAHNSRAVIRGMTDGFIKLVFRADDRRLLGVHILSETATELVHQGQAVLRFGGTIDYFIEAVYNVPSESEAYKYAAYDGLQRLARGRPTA